MRGNIEEEKTAGVYTHNKALLRKLEQLSQARPDECKLEGISRGGQAADYIIPKSWVRITPKRLLTEEQKEERRRNALKSILRPVEHDK